MYSVPTFAGSHFDVILQFAFSNQVSCPPCPRAIPPAPSLPPPPEIEPSSATSQQEIYPTVANVSRSGKLYIPNTSAVYWLSYNKWDNCHIPTLRAHNLTKPTKRCIMIRPVGRLGQGVSHNIPNPPPFLSVSPCTDYCVSQFWPLPCVHKVEQVTGHKWCAPLLKLFVCLYCMYF